MMLVYSSVRTVRMCAAAGLRGARLDGAATRVEGRWKPTSEARKPDHRHRTNMIEKLIDSARRVQVLQHRRHVAREGGEEAQR